MRASRKGLLAPFVVVALAAGCDWRDFGTLQGQTPVLRLDAPSGYQAPGDFGSALLPLAPPADGSAAAWFLASGTEALGLGLMKIDAAGHGGGQPLTGGDLGSLGTAPLTAMAEIPGTGTALLGSPSFRGIFIADLTQATVTEFTPTSVSTVGETLFGVGVAAGKLTGAATPDLVASSISNLHVFPAGAHGDVSPGSADLASCPILLSLQLDPASLARRAMVIGNLLGSGPVVAVGTPGAGVAGSVAFFAATATTVTCVGVLPAPVLTPATTVNAGFGASLAVGDFDGDGAQDLLVGAPPYAVYLYKGPVALTSPPAATILPPSGAGRFGNALAAANIDGLQGDEALVADSGATVDGQNGAGEVSIYALSSTPPGETVIRTLSDHGATAGESYGASVAVLPFCATAACAAPTPLPLVGAPNNAFVYFTVGATDPRTK